MRAVTIRFYYWILDKVFLKSVAGIYPGGSSRYISIKNFNSQQK